LNVFTSNQCAALATTVSISQLCLASMSQQTRRELRSVRAESVMCLPLLHLLTYRLRDDDATCLRLGLPDRSINLRSSHRMGEGKMVLGFCTLPYSSVLVPVSSFASVRVNGRDYSVARSEHSYNQEPSWGQRSRPTVRRPARYPARFWLRDRVRRLYLLVHVCAEFASCPPRLYRALPALPNRSPASRTRLAPRNQIRWFSPDGAPRCSIRAPSDASRQ
jgi:hypothetical protein